MNPGHPAPVTRKLNNRRLPVTWLMLLSLVVLAGFLPGSWACNRSTGPVNILLLSVDTLRADHLGCYGYPRRTSPVLDRLARESLLYEDCLAPAPWTLPSHVAMLSGRHPIAAGITGAASSIPAKLPMLAEHFAAAGYETVAFVDSKPKGFVGGERDFSRGFSVYQHAPFSRRQAYTFDMRATVDTALDWLGDRDPTRPFFLFLHTKSVLANPGNRGHRDPRRFPYDKPEPWATCFLDEEGRGYRWVDEKGRKGLEYLRGFNDQIAAGTYSPDDFTGRRLEALGSLYDAGILYLDHHFGRLLEELERRGLDRNTVLLITSDHGESFLEHQFLLHKEVHRQVLHVPLILRLPQARGGHRLNQPVTLTDVAPTLLELAGLEPEPGFHGRPLPADPEAPLAGPRFASFRWGPGSIYEGYSLEEGRWTLLRHRYGPAGQFRVELYDNAADPGQFIPVNDQPTIAGILLQQLERRLGQEVRGEEISLDHETREHLRALGYLR